MPESGRKPNFNRRYLLLVFVFVISLYVLLPQLGDFRASRHLLSHPDYGWVLLAVACAGLTYLSAAATYCLLAFRRLNYWRTVIFQLAAMFINRLLPAGVGALGANFIYLKKAGHSPAQAGTMVAVNNLFGFIGHVILSLAVLAAYSNHASISGPDWVNALRISSGTALILAALVLVFWPRLRRIAIDVGKQLKTYGRRPGHLASALLSSMSLTLNNVLCLYCCVWALDAHVSFFVVFLIFTFGVGVGTATPTPGGLGGYEAALVAGFVAYHVDTPTALAVALLYRLISYWLALAAGAAAFVFSQRRGYI
jgi:uncharacterized membrane protein YbhN (UPF0104 family)